VVLRKIYSFILPLILVIAVVAYFIVPLIDSLTLTWFARDIDKRVILVHSTLNDSLVEMVKNKQRKKIEVLFNRVIQDERLYAMAFCSTDGKFDVKTETFSQLTCVLQDTSKQVALPAGAVNIAAISIVDDENVKLGELVLVHDLSFIERRSSETREYVIYFFTGLGIVISFLTVILIKISYRGWSLSLKKILDEDFISGTKQKSPDFDFAPLVQHLRKYFIEFDKERRSRDDERISWTPKSLKDILNKELYGDEVIIVSNREPYIHEFKNGRPEVLFPASGVVTALEPIMKACSGTWIAHGSGGADREFVDNKDSIMVPPGENKYKLRRIWLTQEEENGYYFGFANEGLWPLCHIAHIQPVFRLEDWEMYKAVNQRFALAVKEEAKSEDPVILVQDYHFTLLPKMIKDLLPKATVITFWHIPWPNPEFFGICPYREEILEGLLGSTILGFHTPFHCNNFLDTVDRYMECRVDRSSLNISYNKKITSINNYPISIEFQLGKTVTNHSEENALIKKMYGIGEDVLIGIGVDRMDYTKGILERFLSIERFFDKYPEWKGKFSFIQIAAPTRSSIKEYQKFGNELKITAERINTKYSTKNWPAVILLAEHFNHHQVIEYYRQSTLCFVSSLHDGMNLVAKEYIAAKEKEDGVLILSQFTGAAMELPEAIIVNPYNIDQCADAIKMALDMPEAEKHGRMKSMRSYVHEFNVYRWAGRMLLDAARIRKRERILRTQL